MVKGGASLFRESSAVLVVVQDASRRLRRCLTASWTTSVRGALPIGRSGRRNGRVRSNKGMRFYRPEVTCAVWQLGLYGVCRLSVVHRA